MRPEMPKTKSSMTLGVALKWVITRFLSRRRRLQALGVFILMLLGGLSELFTLAAVFPLLAFMSDPKTVQDSRAASLLAEIGVDVSQLSLTLLASLFCIIAVGAACVRLILTWASQKLVFRVGYDLGVSLYERMLYQPYTFHARMNSANIVASVNNVQRLLTGVFLPMMQGASSLVLGTFIIGGLIMINPSISLAAIIGFAGTYMIVSLAMRGRLRRNAEKIHTTRRARVQAVQEGLGAIRDVLIDNSQPVYVQKFARFDSRLRDAQATNAFIGVAPRFLVEALGMVFIVLLALALNMMNGSLSGSLPLLAVLALGAQRLMPLLQQVYHAWANVQGNSAMFVNVVELLRRPIPPRFRIESAPLQMRQCLELDRVSFRYGRENPLVLHEISIEIPRGSRAGFVGKSGSGKSTLMDLVMGLLQPTSGAIKVDGVTLDESNVIPWQRHIAHVSQHIFLADASVTANVALGVHPKDLDEARVREACRLAELEEFVSSLPEGYDTFVGEKGIRLSGGQRQRIGIARALYRRASVLVLDEATSALDDETETAIIRAVQNLGPDYTVLMIAHRVTTLRGCNVIYRLDEGYLVEQGSYAEVIGRGLPMDIVAARA